MVLKRSQFVDTKKSSSKEVRIGKKLSLWYSLLMKSENSYRKPFNSQVPLELTSIFVHFVSAAKIVIELDASPEHFVKAQFDGLKWTKRFPFPQQLHSPNARLRYLEYMKKYEAKVLRAVEEDDFMVDNLEQAKLEDMSRNMGLSKKRILKMYPEMFTKKFRKEFTS